MTKEIVLEGLILVNSTDKAYLVRHPEWGPRENVWVPKSQVSYIDFSPDMEDENDGTVKVIRMMTVAAWVAEQKGLV